MGRLVNFLRFLATRIRFMKWIWNPDHPKLKRIQVDPDSQHCYQRYLLSMFLAKLKCWIIENLNKLKRITTNKIFWVFLRIFILTVYLRSPPAIWRIRDQHKPSMFWTYSKHNVREWAMNISLWTAVFKDEENSLKRKCLTRTYK